MNGVSSYGADQADMQPALHIHGGKTEDYILAASTFNCHLTELSFSRIVQPNLQPKGIGG
jgi:hypothetical protein